MKFPRKQWETISDSAKDFIEQCLDKDQFTRPSIAELFDHPWIIEMQTNESQNLSVQINILQNLIQFQSLTKFQKIVLSLVSGLSITQDEIKQL